MKSCSRWTEPEDIESSGIYRYLRRGNTGAICNLQIVECSARLRKAAEKVDRPRPDTKCAARN